MKHVLSMLGFESIVTLTKNSLADLFISIQADIMIGTLSSNWCRLGDELRKASGHAQMPYLTPENMVMCA